jgi:GWxTD domain-containing protein
MNKKVPAAAPAILLSLTVFLSGQVKVKDLPPQHQEWLKLVSYIILPMEREVFLKLTSDRDREIFIETFWKQRDPTPGTPENEYKDEHTNRFLYANKFYGRSSTREGWQTDMGRIHIILGPPVSIERFESTAFIVPCQAWSYYGNPEKNLPPHFVLLFYQRGGAGDYRLYDPVSDGPAALVQDKRNIDPFNYLELYEKIKEIEPTLAESAISIVPGEYNYDFAPSTRNNIIMADIYESPKKDVSPSYATHFLDYKGIVSTEYMTNFVECDSDVSVIEDPVTGIPFVHFCIAPRNMSVDYYEPKDQYYSNLRLDVSLRQGEDIIFQYNRDFPVYFQNKDTGRIQANGIAIEDSFPAVHGKYRLIILLQNSVGKEFSIFEGDIVIPDVAGPPRLSGPFIGYKLENYSAQLHIPYKVQDRKLVVDPKNTFASDENLALLLNVVNCTRELWQGGEIRALIKGTKNTDPKEKAFIMRLDANMFNKILSLSHLLPLEELTPDYYELSVRLVDGTGRTLDEARNDFIVSPARALPHPIAYAKGIPLSNRYLFHHMLASQNDKLNRDEQADAEYRNVLNLAPQYGKAALDYANFLIKVRNYGRALEVVERIRDDGKFQFEYFLIGGNAQMGAGKYGEAIDYFLEGNKIYNSDTGLLNSLGLCYLRTGDKKKAVETLNASLRLNAGQDEIKTLLEELK